MAGDAQLGIALVGIGQPQHRHRRPSLADRPRGGEPRCPVAEEHRMEALVFGRRRDVYPCFGKHAEPTFGAQRRLAQVQPRRGRHAPADLEFAARTGQPYAVKTVLDTAIAPRLRAGGAGHEPWSIRTTADNSRARSRASAAVIPAAARARRRQSARAGRADQCPAAAPDATCPARSPAGHRRPLADGRRRWCRRTG